MITSLKEWLKGQQMRDRDESFLFSFFLFFFKQSPRLPVVWAAVLNKNLLSSLSLFLYINLPSTNSVSSSAMRHTVICACVLLCVRVCAVQWLSFWQAAVYWSTSQRNRTIIELLKNTLISLWNTLAFSLLSLSPFFSLSPHIHAHTHNVGCICK